MEIASLAKRNTKVLGVSILTSLDEEQTNKYYFNKDIEKIVENKATNENIQIVVGNTVFKGKIVSTKKIS